MSGDKELMDDSLSNQAKDYDVQMKFDGNLLRYFVTGERSFTASYRLWERIYSDCEKYDTNNVHATVILSGVLERMEIPLIIQKLISLNNKRPINCAWVDHNHASYLDNVIGERIPRPDSMNIQIFNNDEDAIEWLSAVITEPSSC
ncbi:hypothetical protein FLL45_06795 [Aliikangiella marina]|uniref:STAS/SEC14 domain-containing protein n=1 Tax=Aliikangiella marina TaxID=1712262 RepID=A0A545TBQ9_9GAMM|nr:hypothetical protein [Aliikangiella marina]TQV74663.1 hypothetical protein FLL45_06795 [Aliikangiella marina]